MADMPNDFWSGWIIILTVVSFVGLAWLVLSVYFLPSQGHEDAPDQVWDGDLREGSNAPPLWWFWMILAAMIFSVLYLMLYPGLGSFKGVLRWSQGHRIEHSQMQFDSEYASVRAGIAGLPLAQLRDDPALMGSAENVFMQHCAACHGDNAQGQASLFPDLRDDIWQWGGDAERIEQTIRHGRAPVMVSWQGALGDEGVARVADYVLSSLAATPGERVTGESMSSESAVAGEAHPGEALYRQFCVACHGVDGAGNPMLGAPNLADTDWLYGGSTHDVRQSIAKGRQGRMPAFEGRLDDAQIRLLVAWLTRGIQPQQP